MVTPAVGPPIWPAIWSAVAASCSVIAAFIAAASTFLTMRIHRANRSDAVRPELMIHNIDRIYTEGIRDEIHVRRIRNVGRGPAFNVTITCDADGVGARPVQ